MTGKAVNEFIVDNFLKSEQRSFGRNMHVIFVFRRNLRYFSSQMKRKIRIIEKFSDDELNDGVGKYAEILFRHMFEKNQFTIVGKGVNIFKRKKWRRSDKNLDFIIAKDGFNYGVEIKNTFDYMPWEEFGEKLEMCKFLGLLPVFPLRCPSEQQFRMMKEVNGLALKFKTRIFPPGNQMLVTEIWNHFRLPINIWDGILNSVESVFLSYHHHNIKRLDK